MQRRINFFLPPLIFIYIHVITVTDNTYLLAVKWSSVLAISFITSQLPIKLCILCWGQIEGLARFWGLRISVLELLTRFLLFFFPFVSGSFTLYSVDSSVNYFRSMHTGSTPNILCSLSWCFPQYLKAGSHLFFLIYSVLYSGCHPCPNSLSQHVLICVFVGPCTLQAPLSSGQPLFFALARDFSGLPFLTAADSFPTLACCCMVENEGWKEFHFGCGYLCIWAQIENRLLQL